MKWIELPKCDDQLAALRSENAVRKDGKCWTPGPWTVEISLRGNLCIASGDAWICGELDNQPYEMRLDEAKANADLIAASPRMYAALEMAALVLSTGRQDDHTELALKEANEAMAAARGEQP